jgi:hypothetical protein
MARKPGRVTDRFLPTKSDMLIALRAVSGWTRSHEFTESMYITDIILVHTSNTGCFEGLEAEIPRQFPLWPDG